MYSQLTLNVHRVRKGRIVTALWHVNSAPLHLALCHDLKKSPLVPCNGSPVSFHRSDVTHKVLSQTYPKNLQNEKLKC